MWTGSAAVRWTLDCDGVTAVKDTVCSDCRVCTKWRSQPQTRTRGIKVTLVQNTIIETIREWSEERGVAKVEDRVDDCDTDSDTIVV